MIERPALQCYDPCAFRKEETPLQTDAAGTLPPDAFGPFRVLHQVGAGALGPVFRAYDPEHDRLVALKLIRTDMPPDRAHALVAELWRVVGAGLTHPILAAPIAAGLSDVTPYLAQEFVSADSLDLVVRDYGPPPPSEALRVATQLAGALDFCAAAQVFHGALHPRDVLVSSDDTRLTGVGLAQACERAGLAPTLRRPYTAPERAAGLPWSRPADVFSLAAVIYEMLTGRRIAGVGERAAAGLGEIEGLNNTALRSVFARALAERPDDRFASGLAFAEALREVIPDRAAVAAQQQAAAEQQAAATVRQRRPALEDDDAPPKRERVAREPFRPRKERVVEEELRLPLDTASVEEPQVHAAPVVEIPAPAPEPIEAKSWEPESIDARSREAEPIDDAIDRRLAPPPAPIVDDLDLTPVATTSPADDRLNRFDDVAFQRELEQVKQMVAADVPAEPAIAKPFTPEPRQPEPVVDEVGPREAAVPDTMVPDVVGPEVVVPEARVRESAAIDPPLAAPVKREPAPRPVAAVEVPPAPKPEARPHVDPAFAAASLTLERGESVPSRSVLPFLLTLLLGAAIGFAGGYAVGGRDMSVADTMAARTETAATAGSATTQATPPHEFTESPIRAVPPDGGAGNPPTPSDAAAVPTDAKPPVMPAPAPPAAAPRPEPAPRVEAAKPAGRLLIRSTPAAARVTIDGRDVGKTPVTERSVALGAHTIRVTRDGYVTEERRVSITSAKPSQTLTFELDRAKTPARGESPTARPAPAATATPAGRYTGALLVESRPTAATVYVDGKPAGTTPVSVESLDAGEHVVHIEMDGFRRWSASVRIVAGQRNKVTASLEER